VKKVHLSPPCSISPTSFPSPHLRWSDRSRNLCLGDPQSLNTFARICRSPSVSSRIGKERESGSQPWHCRGALWRDRGGAFGTLPTPSYRPMAQRHSRRHRAAQQAWVSAPKPDWLTEDTDVARIQPTLTSVTISTISSTLGISESYAPISVRADTARIPGTGRRWWVWSVSQTDECESEIARVSAQSYHDDLPITNSLRGRHPA